MSMKTRFAAICMGMSLALLGLVALGTPAHATVLSSIPCTVLNYNLRIGQSGNDVTSLQAFLVVGGHMLHSPTGYFGGMTFQGVRNFQASQGIITTGFVGPLTRVAIQNTSCGSVPTPVPTPTGVSIYSIEPSVASIGTTVTITGSGFNDNNIVFFAGGAIGNVPAYTSYSISCSGSPGCMPGVRQALTFTVPSAIGPYCPPGAMCAMYARVIDPGVYPLYVSNANGKSNTVNLTVAAAGQNGSAISISSIDAPNSLPINTPGTWRINTTSTFSGNIKYSVSWGDEFMYPVSGIAAPTSSQVQSSSVFTHSYSRTGTYTPTFTVTDEYGRSATVSMTVQVTPIY